jgi:hypothetical protein
LRGIWQLFFAVTGTITISAPKIPEKREPRVYMLTKLVSGTDTINVLPTP